MGPADSAASTEPYTGRPLAIRDINLLTGPNAWSQNSVAVFLIDPGSVASARIEGSDAAGGAGSSEADALAGIDVGQLFAALVLEMQQTVGYEVALGISWLTEESEQRQVVCEYREAAVVEAAAHLAARSLNHLLIGHDPEFDLPAAFEKEVQALAASLAFDDHYQAVLDAAKRNRVPIRISNANRRLIELGTGAYQQRFMGRTTSKTPLIPTRIAHIKSFTNEILRERGLPVPTGGAANSANRAVAKAREIGYPVVVKPLNLNHGRGVSTNLRSAADVRAAYAAAQEASGSRTVIVEQFIAGRNYRVFVSDYEVKAVLERLKATVTGDGVHTVNELIEVVNAERALPDGPASNLLPIDPNEAHLALTEQGLTLDAIPEAGRIVTVHQLAGSSHGGSNIARTDEIHPDNVRLIEMAARAIGLDICGVDVLTPDISEPIWKVGGAINEINSGPEFIVHIRPKNGASHDAGQDYIDVLFPPGTPNRVPVICATGARAVEQTCDVIERIVRANGQCAGLSHATSTTIGGAPLGPWVETGQAQFQLVLRNPLVEVAVFGVDQFDVEGRGLDLSNVDVAIVTRATGDPPPAWRDAAQVLIAAVGSTGTLVLDAADPRMPELRELAAGPVILVSAAPSHPALIEHLQRGGKGITILGSGVTVLEGEDRSSVISALPAHPEGQEDLLSLLMPAAAAVALGIPVEVVGTALG